MTTEDLLVEQHIREYESRLKHVDELLAKASKAAPDSEEVAQLSRERGRLADTLAQMKEKSLEEWAREGGPMVIWDLVADRLERFIERLGK